MAKKGMNMDTRKLIAAEFLEEQLNQE